MTACVLTDRPEVVKLAVPLAFNVRVPSTVAPSWKVTLPVGVPGPAGVPVPGGITLAEAVKVTDCP